MCLASNPKLNGLDGVQGSNGVVAVWSPPPNPPNPHAGCFVPAHAHPGCSLCRVPQPVNAELRVYLSGEAAFVFAWRGAVLDAKWTQSGPRGCTQRGTVIYIYSILDERKPHLSWYRWHLKRLEGAKTIQQAPLVAWVWVLGVVTTRRTPAQIPKIVYPH